MNFLRTTKLRQGKTVRNIKSSLVIPRLSVVENITFILSILLLFMQPLKNAISIFSYIDEFAVLFSFMAFAYTVIRRRSISTIEGKIIASFLLFIFFNRKKKSVTRATVMKVFHRARQLQHEKGFVSGPKELGTFGASYIYPVFLRIGVCVKKSEKIFENVYSRESKNF